MIESKKALAEQVVGAGENWLTEMDTDSLRQLLVLERNAVIDEDEEWLLQPGNAHLYDNAIATLHADLSPLLILRYLSIF